MKLRNRFRLIILERWAFSICPRKQMVDNDFLLHSQGWIENVETIPIRDHKLMHSYM